MHKVVVVIGSGPNGRKTFETMNEEENIEAINTDAGCLFIKVNAQIPMYIPSVLAVFKDWLYWECLEP